MEMSEELEALRKSRDDLRGYVEAIAAALPGDGLLAVKVERLRARCEDAERELQKTARALYEARKIPVSRDDMGRLVREEWIAWARAQPNPKPSWLVPWGELSEPDREVGCRIGERLFRAGMNATSTKPPA